MADYSWFRLLVKAIGMLLIGLAVPSLIQTLAWAWRFAQGFPGMSTDDSWMWMLSSGLGPVVQGVMGAYLLLRGDRLIERCLRDVYGRCPVCGYDLRGHAAATCPECGNALPGRTLGTSGGKGEAPGP